MNNETHLPKNNEVAFLFDISNKIMAGDPRTRPDYLKSVSRLFPYLDKGFKQWKEQGLGNDHVFLNKIGKSIKALHSPMRDYPFDYYYHSNQEIVLDEKKREEFENRMTSVCITWVINRISHTKPGDHEEQVRLMTALQLISTNLLLATDPKTRMKRQQDDIHNEYFFDPSILKFWNKFLITWKFPVNQHQPIEVGKIAHDIFYGHFEAFNNQVESQKKVRPNLLTGFFVLLKEFKIKWHHSEAIDDKLRNFIVRYYKGLTDVAVKVYEGSDDVNGIIYISDHLERILEQEGKLPNEGEIFSVEEWKKILVTLTENESLFNFLAPVNKVREIIGRYDYRALLKYLTSRVENSLKIASLGFGKLGSAAYELQMLLDSQGIKTKIFPVDRLPYQKVNEGDSNASILQYLRTQTGIFLHSRDPEIPDEIEISSDDLRKIIRWRNKLVSEFPQGSGINLVDDKIPVKNADLVTLQGTAACEGNFAKRAKMIENSLNTVNQKDGIFLLEGGMISVTQNITSIGVIFKNGRIIPLSIEVRGRVSTKKEGYTAGLLRLLGNNVSGEELTQANENYFELPFKNKEILLSTIYQAINQGL